MVEILLALLIQSSMANWKPAKDVPYELDSIIRSSGTIFQDESYQKKIKQSLGRVFYFYDILDKKEFYYLFKVTTYKYILRENPEIRLPVNYYKSPYLNQFVRNPPPSHLNDFCLWIWKSLVKDVDLILRDGSYFQFTKAKEQNKISGSLGSFDKKLRLILPWIIYLKLTPAEELDIYIQEHFTKLLDHIATNMKIYSMLKDTEKAVIPEQFNLAPFIIFENPKTADKDSDLKTLDNIVKDISKEDLPKPVDDWSLDSDEYLPENEANNLPVPVDDWLNEY